MAQDDFAIVVGITTYPKINNLRGPERDAKNVYQWLIGQGPGYGSVPDANVFRVYTSSFPQIDPDWADPTAERIEREFHRLKTAAQGHIKQKGQARRLYIFLAGHGLTRDLNGGALLAANANYDELMGLYIEGRWYAEWFRQAAYFKEIVLLMDCCRDDYDQAPERKPFWPIEKDVGAADVRTFYAFATKYSKQAREREIPPGSNNVEGLFTRALMDALEYANRDRAGNLTGVAIQKYVYARLSVLASDGPRQEPRIEVDGARDFPWFAKLPPPAVSFEVHVKSDERRVIELQDGQFTPMKQFTSDAPLAMENLVNGNGSYNLRFDDGTDIPFHVAATSQNPLRIEVDPKQPRERQVRYVSC